MSCRVRSAFPVVLLLLVLAAGQAALGAGFGIYEGSARGNALGGAMAGRADDASAIYYNPAGITQIEGTEVMAGATFIAPMVEVTTLTPQGRVTTETEENVWIPPHLYVTRQLDDQWWAGFGIYSRFGLGTEFDEDWPGRYNSYNAQIQTLSFNPDIALKLSDRLSVAAGLQAMWFDMKLERKLPYAAGRDLDLSLTGDSIGYGYNVAARYSVLDWVDLGVSYQSRVRQQIEGSADIGVRETDAEGEVMLPEECFLGANVKPIEKLSVEVGAVFTGWSTYDQLVIDFDDPTVLGVSESVSPKDWDDTWRYIAGVEYELNEAWVVRAGYVYDETPIPDRTADYLIPANNRNLYSVGCGYNWQGWTLDLSYTYLDIEDREIAARPAEGVFQSEFKNGDAHLVGVSLSTKI